MDSKRRNPSRDFSQLMQLGGAPCSRGRCWEAALCLRKVSSGCFPIRRCGARIRAETKRRVRRRTQRETLGEIEPIKLEYIFQIRIEFSERVSFKTPKGRRAYVPAVSGVIEGPRLQGRVVPHSGADYAGNGRLDAHYMLQASDGTMIYINNTGYIYPADNKPIDRNDPSWGGDRDFYFRLTPVFDTPVGPHDWLTRTVIVGNGQASRESRPTIFTYYAVL